MSLTRSLLKELQISPDAAERIIAAHAESIDALRQERDAARGEAAQLESIRAALAEMTQARDEACQARDSAREELSALGGQFDSYRQQVETEKKTATLTTAARKLLTSKGMPEKLADLVMAKRGLDGIELDDKGAIKDSDKLIDALKGEYGDLFSTQQQQGTPTTTPPSGGNATHGSGRAAALAAKYAQDMYGAVALEGANK